MFLKVFVFSLIFAGIKTVFYEEIENYQKCQTKFKGKLFGDYLFFCILFPFHFIYYITKGNKDFTDEEDGIIRTIRKGLHSNGGYSKEETQSIRKDKISQHMLETFYSLFKIEGDDLKMYNKDFIINLKRDYFMDKIQLEKRDVYVMGKRRKEKKSSDDL